MREGFSMATLGAEDMPNSPSPMQPWAAWGDETLPATGSALLGEAATCGVGRQSMACCRLPELRRFVWQGSHSVNM